MPTLADPQKAFGYSRKSYDSYFPSSRPMTDADKYAAQSGDPVERRMRAEQMVQSYLGEMDALAEAKRERALRQEFAPQIDALQREELKKKFSSIGAQDRTTQMYERLRSVNPATPEGKMAFSKAYNEAATEEERNAIMDAAGDQERILGRDFGGEEQRQEQRAVADYMAQLPPKLRAIAQTSGGKTLAEIKGAVDYHENELKIEADLAGMGVDPKEFATLKGYDGAYDPVKVRAREYKAKVESYDRPLTEKQKMTELRYARSELLRANKAVADAIDADEMKLAKQVRDQTLEHIRDLGGDVSLERGVEEDDDSPTDAEKVAAFKAKYGKAPTDAAHWSQAYTLAKGAKKGATAAPTAPMVPTAAIDFLKKNPTLKSAFDAKYGKGAADQILGSK